MTETIRVVVVDDQRVVREGLGTLLDLLDGVEVVGTAADGEEAVDVVTRVEPDVVLMDLRMPRCDGVEATRRLRSRNSDVKVLMLTTYADDRSVIDALRAGARGYLTKDAGAEEIRRALQHVVSGGAVIDPLVQHHVVEALKAEPACATPATPDARSSSGASSWPAPGPVVALPDGLTPREAEVLTLIARGHSNAEIAAELFIGEATVKSHINHLFAKTGVRDRAQAVTYAYEHGLR